MEKTDFNRCLSKNASASEDHLLQSIFGGTTQMNSLSKSGLRLWVGFYLDHITYMFLKKAIFVTPK